MEDSEGESTIEEVLCATLIEAVAGYESGTEENCVKTIDLSKWCPTYRRRQTSRKNRSPTFAILKDAMDKPHTCKLQVSVGKQKIKA